MREHRYWYAAAALVLVGGLMSAWLYPFSTSLGCATIALPMSATNWAVTQAWELSSPSADFSLLCFL